MDLDPRLWPRSLARRPNGRLQIGSVEVRELVSAYSTPLYVLDMEDLRSRISQMREAFEQVFSTLGVSVRFYYAGKAFLSSILAGFMQEAGLGVDAASGGEIAVAIGGGVDPANLALHGNNKSKEEIDLAVRLGVGSLIVDNLAELNCVAQTARERQKIQGVRVRVRPSVNPQTHRYLNTSCEDQKFGLSLAEAAEAAGWIQARKELSFLGWHVHVGSQIFGSDIFGEAARILLPLYASAPNSRGLELNLGGGFGVAYTCEDPDLDWSVLAGNLARSLLDSAQSLGVDLPGLVFEPGRSLIGPAMLSLYTVGAVKDLPGIRRYVSVDGGMSDNIRPALYGAKYTVVSADRGLGGDLVSSRVVGKHCESGDILVSRADLPADLRAGEILALAGAGAYCLSLASNYNYLPRPAVVMVDRGRVQPMLRREGLADLLARDPGTNWERLGEMGFDVRP